MEAEPVAGPESVPQQVAAATRWDDSRFQGTVSAMNQDGSYSVVQPGPGWTRPSGPGYGLSQAYGQMGTSPSRQANTLLGQQQLLSRLRGGGGPSDPLWSEDPNIRAQVDELEGQANAIASSDDLHFPDKLQQLSRIQQQLDAVDPERHYSRDARLRGATEAQKRWAQKAKELPNGQGWVVFDDKGQPHHIKPDHKTEDVQAKMQMQREQHIMDMKAKAEERLRQQEEHEHKLYISTYEALTKAHTSKDKDGGVSVPDPVEMHRLTTESLQRARANRKLSQLTDTFGAKDDVWGDKGDKNTREHWEAYRKAMDRNDQPAMQAIKRIHQLTAHGIESTPEEAQEALQLWKIARRYYPRRDTSMQGAHGETPGVAGKTASFTGGSGDALSMGKIEPRLQ